MVQETNKTNKDGKRLKFSIALNCRREPATARRAFGCIRRIGYLLLF